MAEEVATNNGPLGMRSEPQPDIGRTQDLEMVATHANVEGLRLPPDLIALAYDRNDGDIVNAIMNLTEPIFRRQLELELAELAELAERPEGQRRYHSMHHPAHRDSVVGGLSDRSYAHQVHHAEEEEEEPPDARELDLWLLESQVPGCTRERAERAYVQACGDVSRALPLVRMTALLADRNEMVSFLIGMQPGGLRAHAEDCYDETEGDIVDAVVEYHHKTARYRNREPLRERCLHRLRIRTVFALALLYRERYGQLQPEASAAIAQAPLVPRERAVQLPSFTTPDGVRWTYSSEHGWERRMALEPVHVGRAAQATEQLASLADARGQTETAARARQTAVGTRNAHSEVGYRRMTPQQAIEARQARGGMRRATEIMHTYMRNDALMHSTQLELAEPHDSHDNEAGWRTIDARALISVASEREQASETSDVESDDDIPQELAEHSVSSEYDDDEENNAPTAGAYASPRAFVRFESLSRQERVTDLVKEIKRNLRTLQEQLDTEMANANNGTVMSEGAYVCMMEAVKKAWESTEKVPA